MSEPKRYGLSRETCDIVEWRYGPYVGIEDYQKIEDKCQRYKAEVKRLTKPGCTRTLRDTIEEQNKQIEALKRDVLEQAAEIRNLNEVIADLHNQADDDLDSIETERIENARLKAEIEKLKLTLEEERQIFLKNWNYDPHYAYLQLNNAELKAEIERLKGDNRLIEAGDLLYQWMVEAGRRTWSRPVDPITMDKAMEAWEAAKKGVQS